MAEVTLRNVWKIFEDGHAVVQNVDLDIKDREFMVLVGPSGCGKSTTLRMIAGLEEISRGEVLIGDRVVNQVAAKDRDIAMVFQNYALYPHMTVYENMAFGLKLRKFPKKEIDQRVKEAAQILGLTDYLSRRPKQLSGGQRQRVAVGRAIVRKPKAFLFDEPLSNLDAQMRVQMRTEIARLHRQLQSTMIYVTHDQVEAMTMGDRICIMKDGVIQQVDRPLNIYNNPVNKFIAGFIGTPPMNFFKGKLIGKEGKLFFAEGNFEFLVPEEKWSRLAGCEDRDIIFGIRPEDIGSEKAEQFRNTASIEAFVEVVEPMGAETYVYLNTRFNSFVAKIDSGRSVRVGEKIGFPLYLPRIHFFDPATEKNLLYDEL